MTQSTQQNESDTDGSKFKVVDASGHEHTDPLTEAEAYEAREECEEIYDGDFYVTEVDAGGD